MSGGGQIGIRHRDKAVFMALARADAGQIAARRKGSFQDKAPDGIKGAAINRHMEPGESQFQCPQFQPDAEKCAS